MCLGAVFLYGATTQNWVRTVRGILIALLVLWIGGGHGRSALYRFLVGGKFPMRFRFAAAYDGNVMTALESVQVAPL